MTYVQWTRFYVLSSRFVGSINKHKLRHCIVVYGHLSEVQACVFPTSKSWIRPYWGRISHFHLYDRLRHTAIVKSYSSFLASLVDTAIKQQHIGTSFIYVMFHSHVYFVCTQCCCLLCKYYLCINCSILLFLLIILLPVIVTFLFFFTVKTCMGFFTVIHRK